MTLITFSMSSVYLDASIRLLLTNVPLVDSKSMTYGLQEINSVGYSSV